MTLQAQKLSVTIEPQLNDFISEYQGINHLKSKSEVVAQSLKLLREKYLETSYQQAAEEMLNDPEVKAELAALEHTAGDGLEHEDW